MPHPLFFRKIISRINSIKYEFILIIRLYFKINQTMRQNEKFLDPKPAHTIPFTCLFPCLTLTTPFTATMFPNKLAPNKAPYNIPKDPPFCHFLSFLIVLATPFNKSLESSRT